MENITVKEWELGYEQLFYLAVCRLYQDWDDYVNPSSEFFTLWDDFHALSVGEVLSYHNHRIPNRDDEKACNDFMHTVCKDFLATEYQRLASIQPCNLEKDTSLNSVYQCWEKHGSLCVTNR